MQSTRRVAAYAAACLLSTGAPAAFAAEPTTTGPIEVITVTSRYREESVQDAPLAVTAFNEQTLQKIVAQDLRDVGAATPNFHIQPVVTFQNSAAVHVRGMGGQNIESTNENRVGISINGVFISRPIATLIDLFDVDRIEVLRGPQGTTFGKNSLAGGLNITTKRPDGEFGVSTEVDWGNYGRADLRAAVEAPLIEDRLAARVSFLQQNYDGHFENRVNGRNLNGEEQHTTRATLVWTPTESIEATLIGWLLREDSTAPGADNDPDPGMLLQFTGPDDDLFTVGRDALDFARTDQQGVTGIIDWDVGPFTLTSITGWIDTDDLVASDFDQTEIPFFPTFRDQVHEQWSQEIRLHSDFTSRDDFLKNVDLVLGLFYFEQEHEIVQSFPTLGPSADYAHQDGDSKAAYGQMIYSFTDRLNGTFGVRYTKEQKDFERNPGTFFPTINPQDVSSRISIDTMSKQPMTVTGDLDSDNTSFKAGLDYRLTDDVLTYVTFAQGFKAGEFGARANSLTTVGPTDDEESDSWEVGIKASLFDGHLQANLAAFYTEYQGLAFEVFFPSPTNPTGQETASQNIGEATTKGIELELTWAPIDNLTLSGSVGLLDAEYDEFCADLNGPGPSANPVSECGNVTVLPVAPGAVQTYLIDEDFTDLELSRAPEEQYYLSAEYVLPTSLGDFFALVSTSYESEWFSDGVTNNPKALTGDFWLTDASVGWNDQSGSWRAAFWCKNCTDKEYVNGLTPVPPFFNQKFYGNPLTYGLTVSFNFEGNR
jgi:iron complex outermembrane receptor protein